ncbi:hypothetical protein BT93_H2958 [Corymbia citriodora subsp. variegata]|nr:hypothetical protein BT93_H2958 [Corymbia citriodora subsp. variegata]
MAESLLFSIADGVLGKIASPALQEAVAIYNVENQIRELRETLTATKAVLSDGEAQQAKNNRLQVWLDQLQLVFYDAEDVLDELECEALRKQVISRYGGIKGKVHRFFSLSNPLMLRGKISHKIHEIQERLSRISIEKDQFDLNVWSADNGVAHTRSREMTYSFINKSDVVGRDIDKEKIIKMLMQSYDKNLSVFPIVGIGVCVPEDFDLTKTIEGIIKDATRQNLSNFDIQQLQTIMQDVIKDKKFLLVLDDIWSNDHSRLKDMLIGGASESKIIVTAHSANVTSIMGTHPAHNLKSLSHENSMGLIQKMGVRRKRKGAMSCTCLGTETWTHCHHSSLCIAAEAVTAATRSRNGSRGQA